MTQARAPATAGSSSVTRSRWTGPTTIPRARPATSAQLVNAAKPSHFPAFENGGIGGVTSSQGAQKIDGWLSRFPGNYVGLAYGTNDANGCGDTTAFYSRITRR